MKIRIVRRIDHRQIAKRSLSRTESRLIDITQEGRKRRVRAHGDPRARRHAPNMVGSVIQLRLETLH